MGRRLPPGEAERRAAERQRAFFAGEKHKKYDPETEGYGDYAQWASAASAFINGETIFIETTFEQPPLDEQEVLRKTKRQGRSSWGVRRAARPVWFKRSAGIRTRVQSGAARMKRFHHTAGK